MKNLSKITIIICVSKKFANNWCLYALKLQKKKQIRFDEMRIRYERREPRAEDIREIQELKSVIEAQDRDLRLLTEKLREFQMHRNGISAGQPPSYDQDDALMQAEQQQQPTPPLSPSSMMRKMKKPLLNCDVIYEAENEEEEEVAQRALRPELG